MWSAIRIGLGTTLEDIETAAAEILDAVRAPVLHVAGAPADEDAVPRAARVVRDTPRPSTTIRVAGPERHVTPCDAPS